MLDIRCQLKAEASVLAKSWMLAPGVMLSRSAKPVQWHIQRYVHAYVLKHEGVTVSVQVVEACQVQMKRMCLLDSSRTESLKGEFTEGI